MHQRQYVFAKGAGIACVGFLACALALDFWPSSSGLSWLSFGEAQARAHSSNKPVFLDVYAEWCGPCKEMDRSVFPDDSVSDLLLRRFELAKVNLDDPLRGDSVKKQFQLRAIPTYIILTPGGREIKRHVGFFEKSAFIQWLQDSSHLLVYSWLNFEKAKAQASFQEKRLLALVIGSSEEYEEVSSLFDTPDVQRIIDSAFIPTMLIRTNKADEQLVHELGAAKTTLSEVFVLDGEREIGRFIISPNMFHNQNLFLQKLYELSGVIPGTQPRFLPQRSMRRISLSSTR